MGISRVFPIFGFQIPPWARQSAQSEHGFGRMMEKATKGKPNLLDRPAAGKDALMPQVRDLQLPAPRRAEQADERQAEPALEKRRDRHHLRLDVLRLALLREK
jgi:hypothetical protein